MAKQVWGGAAPRVNPSRAGRLVVVVSLEFPRGEAPQVEVELVQARVVAVMRELKLEFELIAAHGLFANDAAGADARASPRAIRSVGRHLAGLDRCTSLLPEKTFVWHLVAPDTTRHDGRRRGPWTRMEESNQLPADPTPVASNGRAQWKVQQV
jgi:hypothetical protein